MYVIVFLAIAVAIVASSYLIWWGVVTYDRLVSFIGAACLVASLAVLVLHP